MAPTTFPEKRPGCLWGWGGAGAALSAWLVSHLADSLRDHLETAAAPARRRRARHGEAARPHPRVETARLRRLHPSGDGNGRRARRRRRANLCRRGDTHHGTHARHCERHRYLSINARVDEWHSLCVCAVCLNGAAEVLLAASSPSSVQLALFG